MSARGGARPGAGRRKGSVAKHRKLANEATQQAIGTGETPLAFLLAFMRDPGKPDKDRLAAATAAAGYVHPKLSSVEVQAEVDATVAVSRIELVAPALLPAPESDDHSTH